MRGPRTKTAPSRDHQSAKSSSDSLALLVIVIGVLITAIDATVVILALPQLRVALHLGLSSVIWVVTSYLVAITLLATQVGRLGDMFGRVRMYELGFVIFTAGSAACALSWNEASILASRVIQGVGASLVSANAGAVIADTFPPELRGRAYGYNAVGWNIGAVMGVMLGGTIVTYASWRWIFWINIPIGLFALFIARRVLRDQPERHSRRLDLVGMSLLGAGLFGLLWGMTTLTSHPLDVAITTSLIGGVVFLALFALSQTHRSAPMMDLSIFKVPTIAASLLASYLQSIASYSVLFLLLMYLQGVKHLNPLIASLLLVPGYIAGGIIGPISGRYADQKGSVLPATVGLGIGIVSLLIYAQLTPSSSLYLAMFAFVLGSIGTDTFFPANSSSVMRAAPLGSFGIASGMLRTFTNLGMVFSFTLAILVASRHISRSEAVGAFVGSNPLAHASAISFTEGLHAAFYLSAALMILAGIFSVSRALRSSTTEVANT